MYTRAVSENEERTTIDTSVNIVGKGNTRNLYYTWPNNDTLVANGNGLEIFVLVV